MRSLLEPKRIDGFGPPVRLTVQPFVAEGEGLYARAMQHEQDHLENRLLIDHVGSLKRQLIKRKLERLTREELEEAMAQGDR